MPYPQTHHLLGVGLWRLLRNKANFGILEGFQSEPLHHDIRIERNLESEANQEAENDKFNRVDILAEDARQQFIIVELPFSDPQNNACPTGHKLYNPTPLQIASNSQT